MKIDLDKMSDEELLALYKKILDIQCERELVTVAKSSFSRHKELKRAVDKWFGDDLDDGAKGEVIYNFVEPTLRKFSDYISGNYELKIKDGPNNYYPYSVNYVKAMNVKKYRAAYDALVEFIVELTEKEKSDEQEH